MKKKLQYILKYIPLMLFVGYYSSISFFTHTHFIDKVLVVHSHPFSSSDNHQHSTSGFQLIHSISHFLVGAMSFGGIFVLSKHLIALFKPAKPSSLTFTAFNFYNFLRPPPTGSYLYFALQ